MESSTISRRYASQIKDQPIKSYPINQKSIRMRMRSSPYLPTPLEFLLLSVYPATLIIGSLFSLLDPAARSSEYNVNTQSHSQISAPSYFAKKNNIFNVYFVKKGWAWITFSYVFFLFSHPSTGPTDSLSFTSKRIQGLLRYSILTFWWIFVTQWFFGPPLIDRGFTFTGGQCELQTSGNPLLADQKVFLTATACKAVSGHWKGGHDISGHVFLLVLGSMFLFQEVLHVAFTRDREERIVKMTDGAIRNFEKNSDISSSNKFSGVWTLGSKIAIGVASMNIYMLLMTAAYFHTWFEKLTGLMIALIGIFIVYFLPRAIPNLRTLISMPGVEEN